MRSHKRSQHSNFMNTEYKQTAIKNIIKEMIIITRHCIHGQATKPATCCVPGLAGPPAVRPQCSGVTDAAWYERLAGGDAAPPSLPTLISIFRYNLIRPLVISLPWLPLLCSGPASQLHTTHNHNHSQPHTHTHITRQNKQQTNQTGLQSVDLY